MDKEHPRDRLIRAREALGWSRTKLAAALDVGEATIYSIETSRRWPGRRLANAIEALSEGWDEGPIKATDWDEAEDAEAEGAA